VRVQPTSHLARSRVEVVESRYLLDQGSSGLVEKRESAATAIAFELGSTVLDEADSRAVQGCV
jgi:hypothetical protein